MQKIGNLKDLFITQGRQLYSTSRQEQNELPNIRKRVNNEQLKTIIDRQVDIAKNQGNRLQDAFNKLRINPDGERNECSEALLKQAYDLIDRSEVDHVRDAAIVHSIQRLNHNNITTLGALSSYAKEIGENDIAGSLNETLNQEKAVDKELSDLARQGINKKAMAAAG